MISYWNDPILDRLERLLTKCRDRCREPRGNRTKNTIVIKVKAAWNTANGHPFKGNFVSPNIGIHLGRVSKKRGDLSMWKNVHELFSKDSGIMEFVERSLPIIKISKDGERINYEKGMDLQHASILPTEEYIEGLGGGDTRLGVTRRHYRQMADLDSEAKVRYFLANAFLIERAPPKKVKRHRPCPMCGVDIGEHQRTCMNCAAGNF